MAIKNNKTFPKIKAFGFGGCGCNTIAHLNEVFNQKNIELIAANTDFFSLSHINAHKKITLGRNICSGLGTGGDTNQGRAAAEESHRILVDEMRSASLIFLTAGMGGGTGSSAIEIAARIAASMDIPSISIVSLPFSFESDKRKSIAYESTIALQKFTNTLVTIPNDKLLSDSNRKLTMKDAFMKADNMHIKYISGLLDLITVSDTMHIDLSYILNIFDTGRNAYISTGQGFGAERIFDAIDDAFNTDFMEENQLLNADQVIIKLTGSVTIEDVSQTIDKLKEKFNNAVHITPIISPANDSGNHLSISILFVDIGAAPIALPSIWSEHVAACEHSHPLRDENSHKKEFEDILEVPAFLRREI